MADRRDHPAQAHATAKLAGAATVRDQAIAFDPQREFHLNRLDRQVRGVGDMDLHTVLAVAVIAPPMPPPSVSR